MTAAIEALQIFHINYWYVDPYDASYDGERSCEIQSTTKGEAIEMFRKDYGDHSILFVEAAQDVR